CLASIGALAKSENRLEASGARNSWTRLGIGSADGFWKTSTTTCFDLVKVQDAMCDPLFPLAFVLDVDSELLAVSRFPIAQVGFEDHVSRLEHPTQFRLIFKPYTYVEHSLLEDVFGPIDDLAS